jgi:hypothetical protein
VLTEFYFLIVYYPGSKNMLADTLSYYKQDIELQEALDKAHYIQVLLISNKLDLEINYKLATKLALISKTLASTSTVLTNRYTLLDLID